MEEVPFDDRHIPKAEIDWDRSCWWWYPLSRAIHPAIRSTSLALSLIIILLLIGGWRLGNIVFAPDFTSVAETFGTAPASKDAFFLPSHLRQWTMQTVQFVELLFARPWTIRHVAFLSFEFLWFSLILSIGGGILARRSMVELGQRTVAPWLESINLIFKRWHSFLWSSGMHLVAIGLLLLIPAIFGLFCRLGSVGAILGGILLLISYPLALGVGRLCLSLIACYPLSVCAIAAEKKADAFEGFSRSNAYFFQRPAVATLCAALLMLIGLVGEQLVTWTLRFGWWSMRASFLWAGAASEPASAVFLDAGQWLTESLIGAFWLSYFWSASGGLYLILRRLVDNKDLSEIDLVESSEVLDLPEIPTVGQPAETPT